MIAALADPAIPATSSLTNRSSTLSLESPSMVLVDVDSEATIEQMGIVDKRSLQISKNRPGVV